MQVGIADPGAKEPERPEYQEHKESILDLRPEQLEHKVRILYLSQEQLEPRLKF